MISGFTVDRPDNMQADLLRVKFLLMIKILGSHVDIYPNRLSPESNIFTGHCKHGAREFDFHAFFYPGEEPTVHLFPEQEPLTEFYTSKIIAFIKKVHYNN